MTSATMTSARMRPAAGAASRFSASRRLFGRAQTSAAKSHWRPRQLRAHPLPPLSTLKLLLYDLAQKAACLSAVVTLWLLCDYASPDVSRTHRRRRPAPASHARFGGVPLVVRRIRPLTHHDCSSCTDSPTDSLGFWLSQPFDAWSPCKHSTLA